MKLVAALLPSAALAVQFNGPSAQIPLEPSTVLPTEPLTLDAIPLLGFGTWNLKSANVSDIVSYAIQSGYRHIDCAAAYGNEDKVGRGIADGLQKTGLKREDLWITSKLWNAGHGTNSPAGALTTTLQRLGVGYLDLYHMHWPVSSGTFGSKIEYLDTWAAMGLLLEKGMTRHIGISNFDPIQLKTLLNHTSHPPAVHQMEMHPYLQQNDWLEFHEKHGIHVTAYSPLAGTNPTYEPGDPTPLLKNKLLKKIADKRGCTPAQVALAWGMSRGTSVIPKSAHTEYIDQNFASLDCNLKKKDIEQINELGKAHHRYSNPRKSLGLPLFEGLEDSEGKHEIDR